MAKKYKLASDEVPTKWITSEPDLSVIVPGNNSLFADGHFNIVFLVPPYELH